MCNRRIIRNLWTNLASKILSAIYFCLTLSSTGAYAQCAPNIEILFQIREPSCRKLYDSGAFFPDRFTACEKCTNEVLSNVMSIPGSVNASIISGPKIITDNQTNTSICYADITFYRTDIIVGQLVGPFGGGVRGQIDYQCGAATQPTLSLTIPQQDPKDPYPFNLPGKKSSIDLIAKVIDGAAPKAGVVLQFSSHVTDYSGGHEHSGTRPEAKLAPVGGATDANGEVRFKFNATEFAGEHVVTATCNDCSNKTANQVVTVRVPDLFALGADSVSPARYVLIGSTPKHPANHFFTVLAKKSLFDLFEVFSDAEWGVVGVNDSSTKWGGRFDIAGAWGGSHHEHREGQEVDVSFYNPASANVTKRQKVYDHSLKASGVGMPQVLWHMADNSATGSKAHFHLYLLGQKASSKIPY